MLKNQNTKIKKNKMDTLTSDIKIYNQLIVIKTLYWENSME